MKKLVFPAAIALLFFCISCNNEKKGGLSAQAQKNLDAFHVVDSAFQTGDTKRIDEVVASDFVDHTDKGDMGRDSLKAMIIMMKNSGGDMKSEVKKEFADDEYVMAWMRWTGTSDGSMGMPVGPYDMTAIELVRFKDGMAVEHWSFMEPREMMKMMSSAPSATPEMKKDSVSTSK